ncbi:MAG: DNA polymerase I [Candidatus Cryptobacteroides sp.]|nr:DNA polymerase I [Candidatus Cryptobacteroides sp.]
MDRRLFLIDGHALVFRMYYAFYSHPMINSKGVDTSILFGFTKYLLELIEKEKPSHLAVAFDPPGGTFRHELYPEYKGTRAETPQLVIDALEPLQKICESLHIPVLMVPGYEADDVIGTMAKKAEKEGFTVYMVTPDKDYGQLISPNIIQYKPGKNGSDPELVDVEKVCSKYGISSPQQVVEILTLCGDSSDNVPGVKGIGEVGAGKLVSKYGTVDNIYKHLEELTSRQREALDNAKDHISLSHTLVTIDTAVPLSASFEEMVVNIGEDVKAAELFEEYEFGSLRKYLKVKLEESDKKSAELTFSVVEVEKVVEQALRSGECAIVTAGVGSIFDVPSFIAVAASESGQAPVVASASPESFAKVLESESVAKIGYNLKGLFSSLENVGIALRGRLFDVELMHYLINPELSHKFDILSRAYLGLDVESILPKKDSPASDGLLFDFSNEDSVRKEEDGEKERAQAAAVLCLGRKVREDLDDKGFESLYSTMEEPLISVLARMEKEGVKVDLRQLRSYASSLEKEMNSIAGRVREMADDPNLNILSPKQIGVLLFEKLKLDPKMKPKSGVRYTYPTDEDTLSALSEKHPIVDEILEYRGVKKLLSTYIEPFPTYVSEKTGKIHTTFNQALTATGRLSSSKPNLQNIPIRTDRGREIRKAFVSSHPDGVILSADYSQIELRIMAHLSCDSHLIDAFNKGIDVHSLTASKIFGIPLEEVTPDHRRIAKTANFGIMYGISAFGLAQRLKISRAQSKKIIEDYFSQFPSISSYIEDTLVAARECGYVETIFGRRRYLPEINARNATVRSLAERNAINAPIQGTSADVIKLAMINVDRRLVGEGLRSRMVLQIHDELVFDAFREEVDVLAGIVKEEMEKVVELSVPLIVECNYGNNWLEAH